MFIAKFSQVSASTKANIKPNADGEMPYIGRVMAGTATSTIINASFWNIEGLEEGVLYLCENSTREYQGKIYPTVEVACPINATEYVAFRESLGAPVTRIASVRDAKPAPAPEPIEEKIGDPLVQTS